MCVFPDTEINFNKKGDIKSPTNIKLLLEHACVLLHQQGTLLHGKLPDVLVNELSY